MFNNIRVITRTADLPWKTIISKCLVSSPAAQLAHLSLLHVTAPPVLLRTSSKSSPFPWYLPLSTDKGGTRQERLELVFIPRCRPHLCPSLPLPSRPRRGGTLSIQSQLLHLGSWFHYFLSPLGPSCSIVYLSLYLSYSAVSLKTC